MALILHCGRIYLRVDATWADLCVEVCRVEPPGSLFDSAALWYDSAKRRWGTTGWLEFKKERGRQTPEALLEYLRELRQELTQKTPAAR